MKYKVGDKVKVKKDLKGEEYGTDENGGRLFFNSVMEEYRGTVLTINQCLYHSGRYKVDENDWIWCASFFDGLVIDEEPEPQPQPQPEGGPAFKVGDRVRVKRDLSDSKTYRDENGRSHCGCVEPMLKHAGKVVTIKNVIAKNSAIYYNICEGGWNWVYEEFDGLATEEDSYAPWVIEEEPPEETPQWIKPATEQLHTDWTWEDLF